RPRARRADLGRGGADGARRGRWRRDPGGVEAGNERRRLARSRADVLGFHGAARDRRSFAASGASGARGRGAGGRRPRLASLRRERGWPPDPDRHAVACPPRDRGGALLALKTVRAIALFIVSFALGCGCGNEAAVV